MLFSQNGPYHSDIIIIWYICANIVGGCDGVNIDAISGNIQQDTPQNSDSYCVSIATKQSQIQTRLQSATCSVCTMLLSQTYVNVST